MINLQPANLLKLTLRTDRQLSTLNVERESFENAVCEPLKTIFRSPFHHQELIYVYTFYVNISMLCMEHSLKAWISLVKADFE